MGATVTVTNWRAGNAGEDTGETRGWLLGHFIEPPEDVRSTEDVEVKWGVHAAGEKRADWTADDQRSSGDEDWIVNHVLSRCDGVPRQEWNENDWADDHTRGNGDDDRTTLKCSSIALTTLEGCEILGSFTPSRDLGKRIAIGIVGCFI